MTKKTTSQGSTRTGAGSSGLGQSENVVPFLRKAVDQECLPLHKTASVAGGSARKRVATEVLKRQFRAREAAGLQAAILARKMRVGAGLSTEQLASRLGMASGGRLHDIEAQRVRADPVTGQWRHIKVPLDILYEIAGATGYELRLGIVKPGVSKVTGHEVC